MSDATEIVETPQAVDEIIQKDNDHSNMTLEQLVLLINFERLENLKNKLNKEFGELTERQDHVHFLHQIIQRINKNCAENGTYDCKNDSEMQGWLQKAKDLGVEIDCSKGSFSKLEKERLVENIKMTVDDFNVKNDLQMQTVNRLTNERYESYQLARSILNPLHEDKKNKARAIAGR